jgi:hypothetical protein
MGGTNELNALNKQFICPKTPGTGLGQVIWDFGLRILDLKNAPPILILTNLEMGCPKMSSVKNCKMARERPVLT